MTKILLVFHTSEGQTAKIADRIASTLRNASVDVAVHEVSDAPGPEGFDGVIVGDSIHAVHHSRPLTRYLRGHRTALDTMPFALFQVSLTSADPDAEHTATAQRLVQELLDRTGFDPDLVGLFAGALVYTQYGYFKRRVMRAVSRREGGDTDMTHDHEYTDWQAVEQFARDLHRLVHGDAAAAS